MYYTVVDARDGDNPRRFVYTGLCSDNKEGLLEKGRECFPQYSNLKVVQMPGENPDNKKIKGWLTND